ncbi:hypothetical protein ACERIM_02060 [Natrinema sp. H-ect1]|uniref:hypothetical protein n=1 Tax=Natrinema sp. H-ect1 TaxID=3242700 RepID=UPI00359D4476
MDSIRRANRGNIGRQDISEISSESVRVEIDPEGETADPIVEDYPYSYQTEYTGTVYYQESSPIPSLSPNEEAISFRYREESGLFILQGKIDETKSRAILQSLNKRLEDEADDVLMSVSYGRVNLWSFICSARTQTQIVVRDESGNKLSDEDIAHLSQRELAQDYSLDQARAVFYHQGERINVSYDSGILNFVDSVSSDGKEYVLQLFEKYVVAGAVLEQFESLE